MNKVVEEALTSMIKRIEVLEEKMSKPIPNTPKGPATSPTNHSQATVGQIGYINNLKGETWEGMTKKEAGAEIDRLLKGKQERTINAMENAGKVTVKELRDHIVEKLKPLDIIKKKEIEMFKREVDEATKEHYKQESKPLTKEEITEIGEENLL